MKSKIMNLFVTLILVMSLVPFASADSTGLLFHWVDSPLDTSLEVMQGDTVSVEYVSWASGDYDLDIEVLDSGDSEVIGVTSGATSLSSYGSMANNVVSINTNTLDGDYTVVAYIESGSASDEITLDLTVNVPFNNVPEITSTPSTAVEEGEFYTYNIVAYDADCDSVTFEEFVMPGWASLNHAGSFNGITCETTATVSGTAPESDGSPDDDWDFIIKATDEGDNIVYDQWIVSVGDTDEPEVEEDASTGLLLHWLIDTDDDGILDGASVFDQEVDYCDAEISFEYISWASEEYELEIELRDGGVLLDLLVDDSDASGDMLNDVFELDSEDFVGSGTYTVEATVTTDTGAHQTETLTVTATGVDSDGDGAGDACDFPQITVSSGDHNIDEDETLEVTIEAEHSNDEAMAFEVLIGATSDLGTDILASSEIFNTIDNGDGTVDITILPGFDFITHPETEDGFTVTVTVTDSSAVEDSTSFEVTINDVNQDPTITSTPVQSAGEGQEYESQVEVEDLDGDEVSYAIDSSEVNDVYGADTMVIDTDGLISWSVSVTAFDDAPGADGIFEVSISVDDGFGGSDVDTWEITVGDNSAPTLVVDGETDYDETETVELTVSGTDSDDTISDLISLDVTTPSDNVDLLAAIVVLEDNFNAAAEGDEIIFLWDTSYDDAGVYELTFTLTDGLEEVEEVINITVNDVVPTFEVDGETDYDETETVELSVDKTADFTFELDVSTTSDNVELLAAIDELEDDFDLASDGDEVSLLWETTYDDAGSYDLTFTLSDGVTDLVEEVTVVVNNVNRAPGLSELDNETVYEGTTFDLTVSVSDDDGEDVTVTFNEDYSDSVCTGGDSCLDLDDNGDGTWTMSWVIDYYHGSEVGTEYVFTLVAEDESGDTTEGTFTLTVIDVDAPPVFSTTPELTGKVGVEYTYLVIADDPEGESISFELTSGPDGMELDNDLIEWTPDRRGEFEVVITATDGTKDSEQVFVIIVSEQTKNVKYSNVQFSEDEARAGETVQLSVGMNNDGEQSLEDLELSIIIYELGLKYTSGGFDLESGEQTSESVGIYVPKDARAGVYDVRVMLSGEDYHHVTHRVLRVI